MKNYFLRSIAKILGIETSDSRPITHFAIDSRQIIPGSLFFALEGARVDGHNFLEEVAKKGAIASIVRSTYRGDDFGLLLLKVADPLEALQKLASSFLTSKGLYTFGITGSVGKTTTKEFLHTILESKGTVYKTQGNQNTEIGLPLSLLNTEGNAKLFVAEMGISKRGDMKKLVQIAPPNLAAITSIGFAHTYYLQGGEKEIFAEKSEIFLPSTEKKIVPLEWKRANDQISFSVQNPAADYLLEKEGNLLHIRAPDGNSPSFLFPFSQRHFQMDFLVAAIMAREYGLTWEEILNQIPRLRTPGQRFEILQKKGITIINDAYNAAPLAMEMALLSLEEMKIEGKKVSVLGEMRELGSFEGELHQKIAAQAIHSCHTTIFLGEKWENIAKKSANLFFCSSLQEVEEILSSLLQPGDALLLKGARKWTLETIIDAL